jgi:WD40 repeat protein
MPELTFKGHEEDVVSAAFSPDGKRIVTASDDYTARLWDAQTHKLIGVLKGHKKNVSHAAFSPDGNSIVTASFDGSARLWDVKTRKVIAALNGHEQKVNSAAFSPDGKRIVTASGDGTARLWDAQTHKPIGKPLALAEGTVESVAFSPDGKRIVTGSSSWTPDGKPIARADADLLKEGSVQLWDAQTHKPIGKPLAADGYGTVASVAFSPDGNRIITASGIKAQLWRISRSCPQ